MYFADTSLQFALCSMVCRILPLGTKHLYLKHLFGFVHSLQNTCIFLVSKPKEKTIHKLLSLEFKVYNEYKTFG